jgi:hypothetical protein
MFSQLLVKKSRSPETFGASSFSPLQHTIRLLIEEEDNTLHTCCLLLLNSETIGKNNKLKFLSDVILPRLLGYQKSACAMSRVVLFGNNIRKEMGPSQRRLAVHAPLCFRHV